MAPINAGPSNAVTSLPVLVLYNPDTQLLTAGRTVVPTGGTPAWGAITGALSNQTDLQSALALKSNTTSLATVATSGLYTDLAARPTLGTVSALTGPGGTALFLRSDDTYATPGAFGPYTSVAFLQAAYPAASNTGKHATVNNADYVAAGAGNSAAWLPSAGNIAPYLGQTFTRSFPSNNFNSGLTRGMSRSFHYCRATSVNPTATYFNGRMANAVESVSAAGTLDCSLEYPAGVFTRANECIANGGPVPFSTLVDLTFNVTIPKGAVCYLRAMQRNAGGIVWCQVAGGSNYGVSVDDYMDIGTSDSIDKVMGGTIGPSNGINFFPVFFGAMTTQPSVLIIGTSRETGGVGGATDVSCDLGPTARTVGKVIGYSSYAQSGTLLAQWNTGPHTLLNTLIAAGRFSTIVNEYGINDIPGDTPAVLVARRTLFASNVRALRPNINIIGHTLYPYVSSSDVFVSKANQAQGTNQPKLTPFNNLVRAGIPGEDQFWDVADAIDPFRTGTYSVSRNPNDTARTPASVTGGISGTTLTVSAVGAGTLNVGDPLYDAGGLINDSTWIVVQLSGTTGGIGTYQVSKPHSGFPYKAVVPGGTTITTAGFMTRDGLHCQWFGEETIVGTKGPALLAMLS